MSTKSLDRCSKCGGSPPGGLKNCWRCHGTTGAYCVRAQLVCRPLADDELWGIKILDSRFEPWTWQFEHLCLATAQYGFPFVTWSEAIHGGLPAMDDNQSAVYLRTEPHDGFGPRDRSFNKPSTAIKIVYSFHSHFLAIADHDLTANGH
ncbi:hypothetical protein C8Q78DRAFT_1071839 [Trametes maxima]|nr:hypothetical protein C8Q78DRAFT_1071839 [Trametes maxima]